MIEQRATATDAELLAVVLESEANAARERYRMVTALAELSNRNVHGALGYRGLADLISAQLRCDLAVARKWARAVERFGARRSLTGEPLEPIFPSTAKALASAEISPEHAAVIADTVEAIQEPNRAEHGPQVETTMLEHARTLNPGRIRQLGQRILAHLDPDGPSPDERRQQQAQRRFSLNRLPGSTGVLEGRLSPSYQAIWQTILTALAGCRPDDALGPDDRSIPQRWHDAFEEAGRRLLAAGDLPDTAGLPCQLVITMSLTDLERRAGRATTHHSGILSIDEALKLAADGQVLPHVLSDAGGILAYGRGRRLASPGQRKALFARDRGCTFPAAPKAPPSPRSTTLRTGHEAAGPTWTTWRLPAAITTRRRRRKAGERSCSTAFRTGSHHRGTPPSNLCATITIIPNSSGHHPDSHGSATALSLRLLRH